MFFLATVDHQGQPTVSYKGGDPGFVKIVDRTTLVFPSYDGNGMFLSMGNVAQHAQVGMLFISFERPHRLRVQGTASIARDDPMMSQYKEADFLVRVQLSALWQNCPRYIHRYQKVQPSRYVPREACETPLAEWKRIDLIQDVLSARDAAQEAEALGECYAAPSRCTVAQWRKSRTRMRPPLVKRQTAPESGFFVFFPPVDSWRCQQTVSCSDLISV
jgi:predicted pyridoxine 5'-phosphate oxidase superfamily flavin-nucleotide-binding protein